MVLENWEVLGLDPLLVMKAYPMALGQSLYLSLTYFPGLLWECSDGGGTMHSTLNGIKMQLKLNNASGKVKYLHDYPKPG